MEKGYDEVITQAEPTIGPSSPPGIDFVNPKEMVELELI
jgi:hypothetical protein